MVNPYKGYTYPKILQNRFAWFFWKKFRCPKKEHLWDEVYSNIDNQKHYFHCDACGEEVTISTLPIT